MIKDVLVALSQANLAFAMILRDSRFDLEHTLAEEGLKEGSEAMLGKGSVPEAAVRQLIKLRKILDAHGRQQDLYGDDGVCAEVQTSIEQLEALQKQALLPKTIRLSAGAEGDFLIGIFPSGETRVVFEPRHCSDLPEMESRARVLELIIRRGASWNAPGIREGLCGISSDGTNMNEQVA